MPPGHLGLIAAASDTILRLKEIAMITTKGVLRRDSNLTSSSAPNRGERRGFLLLATAALLCSGVTAYGGPCTVQISELEQRVSHTAPGPESGPTAPQSVGAQLHRQPTPGSVGQAEHAANADADAALDRARKDDAAGNPAGCIEALREAKRLYGID
jgi:hypothetical protein